MNSMDPDGRSVGELLDIALIAHDELRWQIVGILQRRGTREVFDAACALCCGQQAKERALGADSLAQLGAESRPFARETVPMLVRLLSDEEASVVYAAAVGLGHNRGSSVVAPLCRLVRHPDKDVRFGVVFGLLSLDDPRAVAAMIALSNDDDPEVRDWATFGLGAQIDVDNTAIRDALLARARDPDLATRADALLGLAKRKDPRAVEPLLEALRSGVVGDTDVEAAALLGTPKLYPALLELRAWWGVDVGLLESAIATCRPWS